MKEATLKEKFEAVYSLSIRRGEDSSVVWDFMALHLDDKQKIIGLMDQKIKLLQIALREIRDFNDDSEWDNPGEIAKEALTIQ